MKPNIVFDMGQVLMDFAPPKFIARLGYTGDDAQALLQEVLRGRPPGGCRPPMRLQRDLVAERHGKAGGTG